MTDDEVASALGHENTPGNLTEEESLSYIGGYIVKKFLNKCPYLGRRAET